MDNKRTPPRSDEIERVVRQRLQPLHATHQPLMEPLFRLIGAIRSEMSELERVLSLPAEDNSSPKPRALSIGSEGDASEREKRETTTAAGGDALASQKSPNETVLLERQEELRAAVAEVLSGGNQHSDSEISVVPDSQDVDDEHAGDSAVGKGL